MSQFFLRDLLFIFTMNQMESANDKRAQNEQKKSLNKEHRKGTDVNKNRHGLGFWKATLIIHVLRCCLTYVIMSKISLNALTISKVSND